METAVHLLNLTWQESGNAPAAQKDILLRNERLMYSKTYLWWFGVFSSLLVAAMLCIILPLDAGVHISLLGPGGWLTNIWVAFLTGAIVPMVVPIGAIAAKCAEHFGAKPRTPAFSLIQAAYVGTMLIVVLALVMSIYMWGIGDIGDGTTFFDRWMNLVITYWPTAFVLTWLTDPPAHALARLCVKPAKRYSADCELAVGCSAD